MLKEGKENVVHSDFRSNRGSEAGLNKVPQYQYAARGNAYSFHMPWGIIMEELANSGGAASDGISAAQ